MRLYYRITIRDAQGRIVRRGHWRRGHSYVKQFIQILHMRMKSNVSLATGADESGVVDTTGASRTLDWDYQQPYTLGANVQAANEFFGIRPGTGSTAVTISDYAVQTPIAHGTSSGYLEYGAANVSSAVVSGSTASFTVSQGFTNSSGASITVTEFGLIVSAYYGTTAGYFLIARDIGGGAVAHGQTITIEYKISVTA